MATAVNGHSVGRLVDRSVKYYGACPRRCLAVFFTLCQYLFNLLPLPFTITSTFTLYHYQYLLPLPYPLPYPKDVMDIDENGNTFLGADWLTK